MTAQRPTSTGASPPSLSLRSPPGVVGRIAERKLREVQARAALNPLETLDRTGPVRDFAASLRTRHLALIAEMKPRSPSRGPIRPGVTPGDVAHWYGPHAAAISVLCDGPDFGGSLSLLGEVRARVEQPVLCKDFIVSTYQIVEAWAWGADAVLLMCSLLPPESLHACLQLCGRLGLGALVETHDALEIQEALSAGAAVIGVNARDLRSLTIDLDHAFRLLDTLPETVVRVAESGLLEPADVARARAHADACLIGSALMTAPDPEARIRELGLGGPSS